MDHTGLLWRQPQPHRGKHGRHLLPQGLGMMAFTSYHKHEVVRETQPLAVASAFGALPQILSLPDLEFHVTTMFAPWDSVAAA